MNRRQLLIGAAALAVPAPGYAAVTPPKTPKRPLRIEQLGRVRTDDYAWLKPANWKEVWRDTATLDPTIRAYLEQENAYAADVLAPTLPLQAQLAAQMKARTAPDLETPPVLDGGYAYVTRFAPGAQYPRHVRVNGGREELLLDEAARSAGHAFFHVTNPGPSPNHRLYVWGEDVAGSEKYALYLKDLVTGQVIEGPREAFGTYALSPDSQWLFWVARDASSRPSKIYRRRARGGPDVLVYEEPDPAFLLTITLSSSKTWLMIRSWNDVTSEVRLIDGQRPETPPRLVAPREAGHLYTLEPWNDRFVILTNQDGAVDFKLMSAPLNKPERAEWRDLVPHQSGRTITEVHAFAAQLVRLERVEGNLSVVVRQVVGTETPLTFDEPAYVLAVLPTDYSGRELRLTYESPKTPRTWLAVDLTSGARRVVARQPVPAYKPDDYVVRRVHANAADGAEIPITLLHRKGVKPGAPLMLTGYGSYGASYDTGFSIPNLSLADRDWVWAVAHVRGGSEKGRDWFEQARQLKKKVSFTDFITCAEHLIAERVTAKGRIALHGFSAGGLLTGAALNLRPDLFGAVIGQAPFVDMLDTMSDATHPLVPLTRPVWGDPLADPAAYDYIASYSPYENVGPKPYPPVLATTAVGDDRVGFWEPAKWIAVLREKSTSGAPMLLHTEMTAGHVGAGGRFDEQAQIARMYAFAISRLQAASNRR